MNCQVLAPGEGEMEGSCPGDFMETGLPPRSQPL